MLADDENKPVAVLDTAALLSALVDPRIENYTVREVIIELEGFGVKFEDMYFSPFVNVYETNDKYVEYVKQSAIKTGDYRLLSKTDLALMGLAVELQELKKGTVTIFTDDYALSNLAMFLSVSHSFVGLSKKDFRFLRWIWFCPVCHKVYSSQIGFCPSCGSTLRRKPK